MADLLRMDYINSLPQPFFAKLCGGWEWEIHDIDVETGLLRINVSGLLQPIHFGEIIEITDIDGGKHDPESWYNEDPTPPDTGEK